MFHVAENDTVRTVAGGLQEFIAEFIQRNGSINCMELLGYNPADPDEYQRAADPGFFVTGSRLPQRCSGHPRKDTLNARTTRE